MIDFTQLADIIKKNNSFLITSHVNPDADAIGSEMAFYYLLKKLGKSARIINYSPTPYNLIFLDKDRVIELFNETEHHQAFNEADVLVALDFNNPGRIVKMSKCFIECNKTKICIDHHQHPANFVHHMYIDANYAATAHIIYDFIEKTGIVNLDLELAVPLYAAIMTDTGSFRFERTTAEIHRVTAKLLETGVNPGDVFDKIYDQSRYNKIKMLGETLSSIRLNDSKQIAYMIITRDQLELSGAEESEIDGFVNYCLSIEGVRIGLLFLELKDGIKISFRSKGSVPVNLLAEEFGGGGHINASGTRLFHVSLYEYVQKVIVAAERYLISY